MERESFEDQEVADLLNQYYISIKVDREERPDIDHIYMNVCQALTGHGGWPLTILMTPDKKPFYAGTYFPKNDRMGIPGIMTLLQKAANAWNNNKSKLIESGDKILSAVNINQKTSGDFDAEEIIQSAYSDFKYEFDDTYGGFGKAPKFPTPHNLYFLLRYWYTHKDQQALEMVEKTLDAMQNGGIYDHIGFGFSRYSTDRKWLVPHFEKMLYDNSLLAIAYLETYQAAKKEKYADIARQIFTYVLRDMTSPEGGFYSAEDADSEGVEGKFYVWTSDEVKHVLGERDGEWFCKYYDINNDGNFEGYSIPNLIKWSRTKADQSIQNSESEFVEKCRKRLFEYREKRIHPYKDDKILTSWNGLMIAAMACGGRILGENKYTEAAEKAAEFIFANLVRNDGRLMARFRDGEAAYPAYADDYAFLIWGLIELYETTHKPAYLTKALELNNDLVKLFRDAENGGLFLYGIDSEQLIMRPKEIYDGATPSGNSVSTLNFIRLARLTGRSDLEELAQNQFAAFGKTIGQFPRGYTYMLSAILYTTSKSQEIVIAGNTENRREAGEFLKAIREDYRPFTLTVYYSDEFKDIEKIIQFIESYKPVNNKTAAYVCENFTCRQPATGIDELHEMLS